MKFGIIIAIERELQAFLKSGSDISEHQVGTWKVYETQMHGHQILALQSGYGEIDAAAATQLLITWGSCDTILNFGVTGALELGLQVADLFVVRKTCHYDYDVSPIDPVQKHQYIDFPDQYIPLDDSLIRQALEICPSLQEVTVASGDRFVEDQSVKRELNALGCQICDMEIAAIARICFLNRVPCLSVKCISDTYEGNGGDFIQNVTRSAEAAFRVLDAIISGIQS